MMIGSLRADNTAIVQKLRVHLPTSGGDLAPRVKTLVGVADLAPRNMPARAILIVRRFGRDLPALTAMPGQLMPPRDWQRTVSDRMDSIAARAAHPANGAVPPEAEAVWFDDRAQMMACAAKDWLAGIAGSRWWWQWLFGRGESPNVVPQLWVESPQYAPAAMELLAERRAAVPFVNRLGDGVPRKLLRGIARAFSLVHLDRILAALGSERPSESAPRAAVERAHIIPAAQAAPTLPQSPIPAPWLEWISEAEAPEWMRKEARLLLATCLLLKRAPGIARKRSFATRVAACMVSTEAKRDVSRFAPANEPTPGSARRDPASESAATEAPETRPQREIEATTLRRTELLPGAQTLQASQIQPPASPTRAATPGAQPGAFVEPVHTEHPEPQQTSSAQAEAAPAPPDATVTSSVLRQRSPTAPILQEIATSFGGVFFLINAGIGLGYYGDFTTPASPGLDLPIWDFLALFGRELGGPVLEEDAVWPLLADLAGRERDCRPGIGYEDWFREQLPVVRARLMLALGLDNESRMAEILLARRASVILTPSHIDVVFPLQDHPIEIRLGGLDRDPGWVPAAGRYILFHFE
jgi:hypothetical protein